MSNPKLIDDMCNLCTRLRELGAQQQKPQSAPQQTQDAPQQRQPQRAPRSQGAAQQQSQDAAQQKKFGSCMCTMYGGVLQRNECVDSQPMCMRGPDNCACKNEKTGKYGCEDQPGRSCGSLNNTGNWGLW